MTKYRSVRLYYKLSRVTAILTFYFLALSIKQQVILVLFHSLYYELFYGKLEFEYSHLFCIGGKFRRTVVGKSNSSPCFSFQLKLPCRYRAQFKNFMSYELFDECMIFIKPHVIWIIWQVYDIYKASCHLHYLTSVWNL